jgi:predicted RNA polymerase sigma factor
MSDTNFYQAYYNRGTLLKRLGKSDQAQRDLDKAKIFHDYKQQRYSLYPVQWL